MATFMHTYPPAALPGEGECHEQPLPMLQLISHQWPGGFICLISAQYHANIMPIDMLSPPGAAFKAV
jgi:hypothetical protein